MIERHSAVYSQIADFLHYRERWDERPSGPRDLGGSNFECTVEKKMKTCTILVADAFLQRSI